MHRPTELDSAVAAKSSTDGDTSPEIWPWWLAWIVFVVYGSLVPFDYRPVGWNAALTNFMQMPWLDIGLGGRLDWLANVLLYVPVGFLGAMVVCRGATQRPMPKRALAALCSSLISLGVGACLAWSLEFAQLFFAPRTVSLNDVVAEVLGTAIGCILALLVGKSFIAFVARLGSEPTRRASDWPKLYLLIYFALSFFPFDFSSAMAVFDQKLLSGHAAWWWAPVNSLRPSLGLLKLGAEALLVVPFGLALGSAPLRLSWPAATLIGLVAGLSIEVIQLFLLSATSQGASAISRAVGLVAGVLLAPHWPSARVWATEQRMRPILLLCAIPWLLVMASLAGWGRSTVAIDDWMQRAEQVRFLPFYYHYYVGESRAITSVLLVAGSYACVGAALGLAYRSAPAWLAPVAAYLISASFEASKLFLVGQRPDPSNALVAAAAAWMACWLVHKLRLQPARARDDSLSTQRLAAAQVPGQSADTNAVDIASLWGLAAAATIVAAVRLSEGHPIAMALATLAAAACIWRRPISALLLAPVLILLTDVNAYTGIRWVDLTDMAMVAIVGIGWLRPLDGAANARPLAGTTGPIWLVLLLMPGVWLGARGADLLDPNALLSPLGSVHGLLLAKGLLFPIVLAWFVRRRRFGASEVAVSFSRGMLVALACVVALTIYERLAFVGPFDFSSDYRAPGPFTEIALGGAYIECFLAAAVPFAVVAAFREPSRLVRWAAASLVPAAAYATMVTFSRGGQVVFLANVLAAVLLVGWRGARSHLGEHTTNWAKSAGLAAVVSLIAGTILMAPYATTRYQQLGNDSRIRFEHWTAGLGYGQSGLAAAAFGNGLGSFGRESYFQGPTKERPGMFSLHEESGNHWLRVHPGSLSYLDQRVDARYGQPLLLRASVRSPQGTTVQALLCEKDLVQSRQCGVANLRVAASMQWQQVEQTVTLPANPQAGWPPRPIRFTLFSAGNGIADVDELSLTTADGRELLDNGSFEASASHWLYSSDKHLAWHLKNLWLQIYFESGGLGVVAHAALLILALAGAWRAAQRHSSYWLAFVLALLAFQGVGLIDSVIDSTGFLRLYLSLALLACCAPTIMARPSVRTT